MGQGSLESGGALFVEGAKEELEEAERGGARENRNRSSFWKA